MRAAPSSQPELEPKRQALTARLSPLGKGTLVAALLLTALVVLEAPPWAPKMAVAPQLAASVSGSQTIPSALLEQDRNCNGRGPMHAPPYPQPLFRGIVTQPVPAAEAARLIPYSERRANGTLDPAYLSNARVRVHIHGARPGRQVVVVVPKGTRVSVGQSVQVARGHVSPTTACTYEPNLIVTDAATK